MVPRKTFSHVENIRKHLDLATSNLVVSLTKKGKYI